MATYAGLIADEIVGFIGFFFGEEIEIMPMVVRLDSTPISGEEKCLFGERPFEEEKIRRAMFEMDRKRASDPEWFYHALLSN